MARKIGGESPTNGSKEAIEIIMPYIVNVKITGSADYLYHRWNCESVDEKNASRKGSKIRKTDNLENFVYRNEEGFLCIPSEQFRMSIISAAKFKQDPRSPRKSASDLYKAGILVLNDASVGLKEWDYEDKRRAVIQRNAINRVRPALKIGWSCEFMVQVNLAEYINPIDLNETIQAAGRFNGVGDFRPTFGRFIVTGFEAKAF